MALPAPRLHDLKNDLTSGSHSTIRSLTPSITSSSTVTCHCRRRRNRRTTTISTARRGYGDRRQKDTMWNETGRGDETNARLCSRGGRCGTGVGYLRCQRLCSDKRCCIRRKGGSASPMLKRFWESSGWSGEEQEATVRNPSANAGILERQAKESRME